MTLTKEMVESISPYSVGDARTETVMTGGDFAWYKALAEKRVARDVTAAIDATTRDLLSAYIVCHFKSLSVTGSDGDMQSESIGGYSYSRKSDIAAGSSNYESLYLNELKMMGKKEPSQSVTRTDSVLPAAFMLDDRFDTDDGITRFDGVV